MHEIFESVMIQRRNRIWRSDDQIKLEGNKKRIIEIIDEYERQSKSSSNSLSKMWKFVRDVNVLDIGLCQRWDLACRYLSVKGLWLVSTRPADVFIPKIDESDEGSSESIQWSSLNELSLAGRSLRFSDLRFAKLQGANLEGAELQGANLDGANLRDADLSRAQMDGTFLSAAKLQYAKLSKAKLRSANLHRANLQRAIFDGAKLWNVNLRNAKLQRANISEAELQGVDMKFANMDGAILFKVKLTCTNLRGARLRGTSFTRANFLETDLEDAQLQGANFREVNLLDTNLAKSQLEGVDFYKAKIQDSFGMPESWKLAWLRGVKIDTNELSGIKDELSKAKPDILLQDCVKNMPKKTTNRGWLSKGEDALSKGKWAIFDETSHRDVSVPEYVKAWADWTIPFACKNEYTGYSSVKRWTSENPLRDLDQLICPSKNNSEAEQCSTLDEMKKYILDKLDNAANSDLCPGLRTVPDGDWRISDSDWREAWKDDD